MSRIFFLVAATLLFTACKPTEGERCNPMLFQVDDQCDSATLHCVYPTNCGVAFCCPDGPSTNANCQACPGDGGTTD